MPPPTNQNSQPPLLRELIDIPETTSAMDFVLKLTDGVNETAATLGDYVITDRLVRNFDEALGLIRSAVDSGGSKAAYLHGSFGSGKSHFMAVLHALLGQQRAARGRDEFAGLLAKHDGWLTDRRLLLIPYYFLGSWSMEQQILGGYVDYVRRLHPDAPVPAVHRTDALLDNARATRARVGDAAFIDGLPGDPEDAWGDLEPFWTGAKLDAAMAAAYDDGLRRKLVNDLLSSWFTGFFTNAREDAEGFISLDRGLTEIAKHAKEELHCDALVLFLDELILWLAASIGDQQFVAREVQKINNLVEGGDTRRPIPVVSFIARQRDLRDLVGESVTGAVETSVQDTLNLIRGRFDVITLEDRNLPAIARERVLAPLNASAGSQISEAFERTTKVRPEVWSTLLGSDGITGSDRESFRATYPFSPAFMDTLVNASSALQRTRSGLKLIRQLLIDHRDELRLGQLVPLGDLYEVIARGDDRPFTDKLKAEFETAQKLYQTKFRPYLLETHDLTDEDLERARRSVHAGTGTTDSDERDGAGRPLSARLKSFTSDDRLLKTLLLSALLPTVPALRNLTPARLSALNYGSFTSPIPRGDVAAVTRKLEEWASKFGEIQLSTGDDRIVSLKLIDVDIRSVLDQAISLDTAGARKNLVKRMLWDEMGITETKQFADRFDFIWRGSKRSVEVQFGNVRDPEDMADAVFRPFDQDAWRLIVDYPFDEGDHSPVEDRNRVDEELRPRLGSVNTVCWIPASLTNDLRADLGQLVKIEGILGGQQFQTYVQERNPADQHRIRQTLESQRDWLRNRIRGVLRQAYGLAQKQAGDVNPGYGGEDHLLAFAHGLKPKLSFSAAMKVALTELARQMLTHQYPAHPDFDPDREGIVVRPVDAKLVLDYVRKANEDPDGRVEVDRNHRVTMRRIANPLQLGQMHEAAFVIQRFWVDELHRRVAQKNEPGDLEVADLIKWLDEPTPRGLEPHVANLVIASFAEQTNRVWTQHGGLVNPPPELTDSRTRDMALREQELPTEDAWRAATERATRIFGVPHPGPLRGRIVRMFAQNVAEKASGFRDGTHDLVSQLQEHAAQLGLDESATSGRLNTARATVDLIDGLVMPAPGGERSVAVVNHLASADLGGGAERAAMERAGRSISSAREVATRLRTGPWSELGNLVELEGTARGDADAITSRLHEAARADELTERLAERLAETESAATKLVRRALKEQKTPPPPLQPDRGGFTDGRQRPTPPRPRPPDMPQPTKGHAEVRAGEVETVLAELRALASQRSDATIEITWRVVE